MTGLLLAVLEVEDIDGGHYVAGVVAPGVALIGDDRCDIHFRELPAEGGHGGTGYAIDHYIDMRGHVVEHHLAALECREYGGHAFAASLVAGHTGSGVDPLAALHQLIQRPFLAGQLRSEEHTSE